MRILMVLAMGLLAACRPADPSPRGTMADSTFVEAIAEAHLATIRATLTGESADSLREEAFGRLGIDDATFRENIQTYARRPEDLNAIYDRVVHRLRQEHQDATDAAHARLQQTDLE